VNENGDQFENEYDCLGRIIVQTGFDGGKWGFRYDAAGNLVETVRPDGATIETATGDGGITCEERFSNGAFRKTDRNKLGRIIGVQDAYGSVKREYDAEGHLIRETAGETNAQFGYTWHALPLSVQIGTRRLDFKYDPAGRLLEAREGTEFRIEIEHDTVGRTKQTRYPGEVLLRETYDQQSRLVEQEATADRVVLLRRRFEYDGAGRLLSRKDEGGQVLQFVHDSRGNLSEVLSSQGSIRQYVYDGCGNLVQKNGADFQVAPGNRMANTPAGRYEYDAAGRPTRRGETSFAYDIFGRLIGVHKGDAEFRFEYDPLFRRTRKTGPGVDVQTVWAGECVMQHVSASGDECLRYVYDLSTGALLALARGLEWYAVVTDDGGELTEVISLADRSIDWACDPLGFDWQIRRNELPFEVRIRGIGREWDRETGLVYQRMRYYVPDDARFLEPDPIGVAGAWNVYQFCWNQPFLYIDPLGLACPLNKAECDEIFNNVEARAKEIDKRWGDMAGTTGAKQILLWSGAPPVGVGGSMGSVKSHLEEYERQQASLGRNLKNYYAGQCQTHEDAQRKEAMKQHRQQESRKPLLDPRYTRPYPTNITWRGAAL
jgi:RHS repeat-associated protein